MGVALHDVLTCFYLKNADHKPLRKGFFPLQCHVPGHSPRCHVPGHNLLPTARQGNTKMPTPCTHPPWCRVPGQSPPCPVPGRRLVATARQEMPFYYKTRPLVFDPPTSDLYFFNIILLFYFVYLLIFCREKTGPFFGPLFRNVGPLFRPTFAPRPTPPFLHTPKKFSGACGGPISTVIFIFIFFSTDPPRRPPYSCTPEKKISRLAAGDI